MSATDELMESSTQVLRRLLDERGVEYTANERDTQWWPKDNPAGVLAENSRYPHGTLDVYGLTPAQAIAATLGSCNCSDNCTNSERTDAPRLPHFWTHDGALHVELPKLPDSISVRLPDQRDREVGSARVWQYTRSDIDATDARQGDATDAKPTQAESSGTCHDLAETPSYRDKTEFKCSECGYEYSAVGGFGCDSGDEPDFNFCPNCGRRIEVDA